MTVRKPMTRHRTNIRGHIAAIANDGERVESGKVNNDALVATEKRAALAALRGVPREEIGTNAHDPLVAISEIVEGVTVGRGSRTTLREGERAALARALLQRWGEVKEEGR